MPLLYILSPEKMNQSATIQDLQLDFHLLFPINKKRERKIDVHPTMMIEHSQSLIYFLNNDVHYLHIEFHSPSHKDSLKPNERPSIIE